MICSGVNPPFFILPASLCHIQPRACLNIWTGFFGGHGHGQPSWAGLSTGRIREFFLDIEKKMVEYWREALIGWVRQ